mmetsp:Transcript_27011/g.27494  ORF Transcript_27011/g.27494 Transcript_27011/m.27494 type:complete len:83 (+) Transcript_27011:385-633(+)
MCNSEDLYELEETNDTPMSLEIFCQGRSVEIIFQYNGGFCSRQCVSMKQRHVFTCTDQGSGGPPAVGLWCSKLPHCYFSQRK